MLRSIVFIQTANTAILTFMSCALTMIFYEVILDQITIPTWISMALFLAEAIVLIANGWKCPLTTYAEKLGSTHSQITDTFLAKCLADNVFKIYGNSIAVTFLLLVFRMIDRLVSNSLWRHVVESRLVVLHAKNWTLKRMLQRSLVFSARSSFILTLSTCSSSCCGKWAAAVKMTINIPTICKFARDFPL